MNENNERFWSSWFSGYAVIMSVGLGKHRGRARHSSTLYIMICQGLCVTLRESSRNSCGLSKSVKVSVCFATRNRATWKTTRLFRDEATQAGAPEGHFCCRAGARGNSKQRGIAGCGNSPKDTQRTACTHVSAHLCTWAQAACAPASPYWPERIHAEWCQPCQCPFRCYRRWKGPGNSPVVTPSSPASTSSGCSCASSRYSHKSGRNSFTR